MSDQNRNLDLKIDTSLAFAQAPVLVRQIGGAESLLHIPAISKKFAQGRRSGQLCFGRDESHIAQTTLTLFTDKFKDREGPHKRNSLGFFVV